jgi:hypothetical protein
MLEVKIFLHEIEALLRGFENSFEFLIVTISVAYFETNVGASHE